MEINSKKISELNLRTNLSGNETILFLDGSDNGRIPVSTIINKAIQEGDYVELVFDENSTNAVSAFAVAKELDKKQNALISGHTIKTINGESILGEGNIQILNTIGDIDPSTQISFTAFVFTRSIDTPDAPTGGTYDNPIPNESNWSDGVPNGEEPVWMSKRRFVSNEKYTDRYWSEPLLMQDTNDFDVIFSSLENPEPPHGNPNDTFGWGDTSDESTIWMAICTKKSGRWGEWKVSKIKGEAGEDGDAGETGPQGPQGEKGEKGDPGMSVSIGSDKFNNYEELVAIYPNGPEVQGKSYIVDGNLYVWDGDAWENVGQFKGEPGESAYIHIKFADLIIAVEGQHVYTMNDNGIRDGELPGKYQGIYTDNEEADSMNYSLYKWFKCEGNDGFGYEWIYKNTELKNAPRVPNTPEANLYIDEWVPVDEGWSNNPTDYLGNDRYRWRCVRRKVGNKWEQFKGSSETNYQFAIYDSEKALDGAPGEPGKPGNGEESIFFRSKDTSRPSVPNSPDIDNYEPDGWKRYPQGVNSTYVMEWVCKRNRIGGEPWGPYSTPVYYARYVSNTGESDLFVDLDNEMDNVTVNDSYEVLADTVLTTTCIAQLDNSNIEFINLTAHNPSGITVTANKTTGLITITIPLGTRIPALLSIPIAATIDYFGTTITRFVSFKISTTVILDGALVSYSLGVSTATIPSNKHGLKLITSISACRYATTSSGKDVTTMGTLKYSKDGRGETVINNNASIDTADIIESIRFVWYDSENNVVDFEKIFVVKDGSDGKDGNTWEWIYRRTTTNAVPTLQESDSANYDGYVPEDWKSDPLGVTTEYPFEWASKRMKNGVQWGAFQIPILWAKFGKDGANGKPANPISEVSNFYLADSRTTGITVSDGRWSKTIPTLTTNMPYLWNFERTYTTDENGQKTIVGNTEPHVVGNLSKDGAPGVGITKITEYYAITETNTTQPASDDWNINSIKPTDARPWLWNKEVILFSDNTTSESEPRVIGYKGTDGAEGKTLYSWIAYSYYPLGKTPEGVSSINQNPDAVEGGALYMGIAINKELQQPSNNADDYTWSRFKGDKGIDGDSNVDPKKLYKPRVRGEWQATPNDGLGNYVYNIDYRDIVTISTGGDCKEWYWVKTYDSTYTGQEDPRTDTLFWESADTKQFVAAELMLSRKIKADEIEALSVKAEELDSTSPETQNRVYVHDGRMDIYAANGLMSMTIGIMPSNPPFNGDGLTSGIIFYDARGTESASSLPKFRLDYRGLVDLNGETRSEYFDYYSPLYCVWNNNLTSNYSELFLDYGGSYSRPLKNFVNAYDSILSIGKKTQIFQYMCAISVNSVTGKLEYEDKENDGKYFTQKSKEPDYALNYWTASQDPQYYYFMVKDNGNILYEIDSVAYQSTGVITDGEVYSQDVEADIKHRSAYYDDNINSVFLYIENHKLEQGKCFRIRVSYFNLYIDGRLETVDDERQLVIIDDFKEGSYDSLSPNTGRFSDVL